MLKRIVDLLPLGLSVLALTFAIGVGLSEITRETTRTIVIDASGTSTELNDDDAIVVTIEEEELRDVLNEIKDVKNEAEGAARSADVVLSFLEGGSILLGALVALAVVAFGASVQDVRSRLDKSIGEADNRLQASEARMEELADTMRHQVEDALQGGLSQLRETESQMTMLTAQVKSSIKDTEETVTGLHAIVNDAVEGAKRDAESSFRVLSLLLLAEQQVRARNRKTAINTLEEAYELDPNNQTTNYLLGYLYIGRKDFNLAIQKLERALRIDPDFAPALAAMGLAQRRMGDTEQDTMKRRQLWSQAEFNLNKALEADPTLIDADNESYFGTLGGLYRRQGRDMDALQAYEDAVKITPNNSYPVGNLAMLYKKFDNEDGAQRMYDRAIEIAEAILDDHPGDTWARLDLAQSLLVNGQKRKALEQYRNVIERLTESGPLEAAYSGLEFLADVPHPIDGIQDAMKLVNDAITDLQEHPGKFADDR